jgi:hypothetical protein
MSAVLTTRLHRLSDSLAELKVKVRAALATELAGAIGLAVRDVLVVALVDRLVVAPARPPAPRAAGWRDGYEGRDRWGEPDDPWADRDDPDAAGERAPVRYDRQDREDAQPAAAIPAAAAVALGVNVGRWWLTRQGTVPAAVGLGILATALGLAGGPVARAALAVLAAATDVLAAESALARRNPS